jgi:hypothetical protein
MAAIDAYANFAFSKVFVGPAPANTGTSITLSGGTGARMPPVPFNAAVWPPLEYPDPANAEIVRVTARAGDQLTIARAQEGTTARNIVVGDAFAATITKKMLDDLRDATNLNSGQVADARLSANVAPQHREPLDGGVALRWRGRVLQRPGGRRWQEVLP